MTSVTGVFEGGCIKGIALAEAAAVAFHQGYHFSSSAAGASAGSRSPPP
jgi:hypothetical protein